MQEKRNFLAIKEMISIENELSLREYGGPPCH